MFLNSIELIIITQERKTKTKEKEWHKKSFELKTKGKVKVDEQRKSFAKYLQLSQGAGELVAELNVQVLWLKPAGKHHWFTHRWFLLIQQCFVPFQS